MMRDVAVIGAGPAGLMAAEVLAAAGQRVTVYDRMPTPGRKLLIAGLGGLNVTHAGDLETLLTRYGAARERLEPAIRAFAPDDLRAWCHGLGQETFIGSSSRVFPKAMKATPLLRAWLARLRAAGVEFRLRHTWQGWGDDGALRFDAGRVQADAALLALGGASWPRLGTDGAWVAPLRARGVQVADLKPSNCGFDVAWSDVFRTRFEGEPLKRIAVAHAGVTVRGEALITTHGIEGGAIYTLSAQLREAIAADGYATITLDLRPDLEVAELTRRLSTPRRGQSLSNFLRKTAGLTPVAISLLREGGPLDESILAKRIKAVPVHLLSARPIARAISSAGGIVWDAVDARFMLKRIPGLFAAGEMLDWEAPTGGYLLQACFATGRAAAEGMLSWLRRSPA